MDIIENQKRTQEHHESLETTHHSANKLGLITILLIFGLFGIWSIFAHIATTITAEGKVITESYNKTIKHLSGGIVVKVFVKQGDIVKQGDKLIQIDSIEENSSLNAESSQYDSNLLNICRLEAQAVLHENIDCSAVKKDFIQPENYTEISKYTLALFVSEMQNIASKNAFLESKNKILLEQNKGLSSEINSNEKLLTSFKKELTKWERLLKQNAVDEQKSIDVQRRILQTEQQINSLRSKIKENLANIEANRRQITLEKKTFINNALTASNKLKLDNKLRKEHINAYAKKVENALLKAPSEGHITDMKIHSMGEVISPHKPILSIVPLEKSLKIEAYVLPTDIEKVYVGEEVEISFPSFVDPSAIPIEGKITYVSADTVIPEGRKEPFYRILVKFTPKGLEAIEGNGFKIMPGMPTTIFVKIGELTLMQYIMQPFIQLSKGIFHAN